MSRKTQKILNLAQTRAVKGSWKCATHPSKRWLTHEEYCKPCKQQMGVLNHAKY